jgi:hypothetical protein
LHLRRDKGQEKTRVCSGRVGFGSPGRVVQEGEETRIVARERLTELAEVWGCPSPVRPIYEDDGGSGHLAYVRGTSLEVSGCPMPDERVISCEGGAQSVMEVFAAGDQLNVHLVDPFVPVLSPSLRPPATTLDFPGRLVAMGS